MGFKKNELLTLDIIDITNLGFGVAKVGGEVIFVSDTVPGDLVRAKIIKTNVSYAVARVEEYLEYSKERTEGRCDSRFCRACAYRLLSYERELELKHEAAKAIFKKAGLSELEILPVTPSPKTREYRNKAQYPVALEKSGEYSIGFFAPKSHRVTEAASCTLAPKEFERILELLRAHFKKHGISVYNEESGEGLLRHVYLRRAEVTGEILLTLVLNGKTIPASDELIKILTEKEENIVGILINVNKSDTNVILGDEFITLYGRDHIYDVLAGVRLKITAQSFYQVNREATELLYAKAKELAAPKKDELILDLYCGAGSIGLSMAKESGEIIGVEIVESAVECAKENAGANGIGNASFYTADAADTEKLLSRAERERGEKIKPQTVILDPPRAGSDEKLLRYIATDLAPEKIVYISCNPATLARDIVSLNSVGYSTKTVELFDLFPGTGHVESIVCLCKQ